MLVVSLNRSEIRDALTRPADGPAGWHTPTGEPVTDALAPDDLALVLEAARADQAGVTVVRLWPAGFSERVEHWNGGLTLAQAQHSAIGYNRLADSKPRSERGGYGRMFLVDHRPSGPVVLTADGRRAADGHPSSR